MQEIRPTGREVRYPYLDGAQDTIRDADVDVVDLLEDGGSDVATRAFHRVEHALQDGRVGELDWSPHVELLSYPVARVLVSALPERIRETAVEAYAHAEGQTFHDRAREQLAGDETAALTQLASELGIDARVGSAPGTYMVTLDAFLNYAPDEDDGWALTDRPVRDGLVCVEYDELLRLMQMAVVEEVRDGLPHDLDTQLRCAAEYFVAPLADELERTAPPSSFRSVTPAAFPPCLSALLERLRDGEELSPPAEFALVSFLGSAGMDAKAISDFTGGAIPQPIVEYQLERYVRDGDHVVEPPDCAGMQDYGLCVDADERCESVDHPHRYYAEALRDE